MRGWLVRLAAPVLAAADLSGGLNHAVPAGRFSARDRFAGLEALGRLLCGAAPLLAIEDSPDLPRDRVRHLLAASVMPGPARLLFGAGRQPLVDAALLAQAIHRAPAVLWHGLDPATRAALEVALREAAGQTPHNNNWLLFPAMIQAVLGRLGRAWDRAPVQWALTQMDQWYAGDGTYCDGPHFRWDHYNGIMIQPFLCDLLDILAEIAPGEGWHADLEPRVRDRAARHAVVQERMIAPDGTFPALGRSLSYRCGMFHALAQQVLTGWLPETLAPGQVRAGLMAVMDRTLSPPGTFDAQGWLTVGLSGNQPSLAEGYISRGSPYMAAAAFLPLGRPAGDGFWTDPARPWTQQALWAGQDLPPDKARD